MSGTTKFNQPKYNHDHPFKLGIRSILSNHFAPSITKNFELYFETEMYNFDPKRSKNVIAQHLDGQYICEVYYKNPSGLLQYITDVCSWWSKAQVEVALLKFITDKYKTGLIGKDWIEKQGKLSQDVSSGKFETPDSEIQKGMITPKVVIKK